MIRFTCKYEKGVKTIATVDKNEYFRERRKRRNTRVFSSEVDADMLDSLNVHLKQRQMTKKEWLERKICETIESQECPQTDIRKRDVEATKEKILDSVDKEFSKLLQQKK